jgi:hypothetical protein
VGDGHASLGTVAGVRPKHPAPDSLVGAMDDLLARQMRWAYTWVGVSIVATGGGALASLVLFSRAAFATWRGTSGALRPAVLAVVVAVAAGLAALLASRLASTSVVRRRARSHLTRIGFGDRTVDQLVFFATTDARRSCSEFDLVPVEALEFVRSATIAAARGLMRLDRDRFETLVTLCRRWPGCAAVLVPAVRDLDDASLAALVALAPTWAQAPAELIEATRTL